jgi:hypothetical protein
MISHLLLVKNHIAHHLLTLFALGATPAELKKAYADNASYQRPPGPLEPSIVSDMHDPERFKKYLGKEKYYADFLNFFREELEKKGWEDVLTEYLFKGDERAEDMLVRLFAGKFSALGVKVGANDVARLPSSSHPSWVWR